MALQDDLDTPLARAVRKAGSQQRYAQIVGRSQPSIYRDLSAKKPVDLEEVPAVEKALGIPRHELRPDYFEAPPTQPARRPAEQPPAAASCPSGVDEAGGSDSDPLKGMAA